MGVFIGYYGMPYIPENKENEVIRHMDTIMRIGGMMGIETAEMFGHKIRLLTPVRYDKEGKATICMNYFSDEFWDGVSFSKKDFTLLSGKTKRGLFSEVLSAMYYLIELNSQSNNLFIQNGIYESRGKYIGWINHICDEKYIDVKAYLPWEIVELLHEKEDKDRIFKILEAVNTDRTIHYSVFESIYVLDFDKGEKLTHGYGEELKTSIVESAINQLEEHLYTDPICLEGYMKLLCLSNEEADKEISADSKSKFILCMIPLLGRKIITKFLAEKFNRDFWYLWKRVKPYDTPPYFFKIARKNDDMLPAEEVSTKEFLGIADEDRLYFWTPDGDIEITEETQNWLAQLQQELKDISRSIEIKEPVEHFQCHMMKTLEDVNLLFGNVFAFSIMFYEFIAHYNETVYQASIQLLDRLIERQQNKCLAYVREHGRDWGYEVCVRDQSKEIKRYLAVLSNSELRSRYLWSGLYEAVRKTDTPHSIQKESDVGR